MPPQEHEWTPVTWIDNHTLMNKTTDTTTGLTNVSARYLDTTTGTFISLDPVFEADDTLALNGYSYTSDNPVTEDDPTGEMFMGPHGGCGNIQSCTAQSSGGGGGDGGNGNGNKGTASGHGSHTGSTPGCLNISGSTYACSTVRVPGNDNTDFTLGLEWILGLGNANQAFGPNDEMTQYLQQDPNVQDLYKQIQEEIDAGQDSKGLSSTFNYQDPTKPAQFGKDVLGMLTHGRIGSNFADGFLGSYTLNYALSPVNSSGRATLSVVVTNQSDSASFFHPEKWAPSFLQGLISNGPDWVSNHIIQPIWDKRGPTATISQTFTWTTDFQSQTACASCV